MINNFKRINFSKINNFFREKNIISLIFTAYIFTNLYYMIVMQKSIFDIDNNKKIYLVQFIAIFIVCASFLISINFLFIKLKNIRNFPRLILFVASLVFAVIAVMNMDQNIYFNIIILVIMFYIISYSFGIDGITLPQNKINFKLMMTIIAALVSVYTVVIGYYTILRYASYIASTFDFGIFAQMFENMAKTGLPITTVERNRELSHFAVHFSPIYYLLLPGYMIFRTPEYLLAVQALAIASAAFPLALIAKKFNFTNEQALIFAAAYIFYPTLTGGAFFDFHENKFLTMLILWLFYFILSEKRILIYVFAVLVLGVKEDSFLYVFFIAIYMIALRKSFKQTKYIIHGAIIAALSIVYFLIVSACMKQFGLGVMLYRYDIFLEHSQNSLVDVIINVFKNPLLLLANILTPEKLEFILYMLLPLRFMPFASKKYRFIILIIPFIIMNLATDYIYQYHINYQYAYGTTAILFFLTAENLSKINLRYISKLCIVMACFSIILFMSNNFNKIQRYERIYTSSSHEFIEVNKVLSQIPKEASVTATTTLIPHLIMRHEEVYMGELEHPSEYFSYDTDYIINDIRSVDYSIYNQILDMLKKNGYQKVESVSFLEIFKKESIEIEDE